MRKLANAPIKTVISLLDYEAFKSFHSQMVLIAIFEEKFND